MPKTPYYHFIPTKAEEREKGEGSPVFPLRPFGAVLVDVRDEPLVLLDLFNPWEIKLVLTDDIVSHGGLVLGREHVHSNWDLDWSTINRGEQASITIKDVDTGSEYNLFLKKWKGDDMFIIRDNWTRDFVFRRDLKVGDVIGLYWNRQSSSFCFSVLKRVGTD